MAAVLPILITVLAVLPSSPAQHGQTQVDMNTWGFGPWVESSVGSPLPMPQSFNSTGEQFFLDPETFLFDYVPAAADGPCDVVVRAIERYRERIFSPARLPRSELFLNEILGPTMAKLTITVTGSECAERPKFQDDEQC